MASLANFTTKVTNLSLKTARVNPISLSYPFVFVLPLALVPRNRVVSARGENIPL